MKFSTLSTYLQKIENTSATSEEIKLLSKLFLKASIREAGKIGYLVLGRLGPLYSNPDFGLGEKLMIRVIAIAFEEEKDIVGEKFEDLGDLGEVAQELAKNNQEKNLGILDVYEKLLAIAKLEGSGSQKKKVERFSSLLQSLDPLSSKYVVRIVLGSLRLGVAEKTLLAALSWLEKEDKSLLKDLEKIYFVHPDVGEIITKFKEGSVEALSDSEMEIGIPVRLALCQREEKTEKIMKRMEGKAAAEYKLDGTRLQLHLDKGKEPRSVKDAQRREIDFFVATYTRNLEETTTMFPDIVQGVIEQLDVQSTILDGEVIGYDPETEEFLPFQVTAQRKRKYGVAEKAEEVPLKFFVFDLLYLDGENLLSKPLSERRALLESVIRKGEKIIPIEQKIVKSADQLANTFDDAVNKGLEGLVVKDLDACYQAGSRGYSWIKYKHQEGELSDTLDCVVLGYYAGQGKRAELGIGAFLVGVYKQERNRFETVAKIGTGLTDEQWEEMRRRCDDLTVEKQPANVFLQSDLYPDTWVRPEMVVEIFADEITQSPVHTAGAGETGAGYALRFPRLISWRDDKNAQDATTADEIIDLYEMQK